jgi:hypothetical protein
MMLKSLRATQATELNGTFNFKSLMTELQNTHRKVEIPKMRITLSGHVLEGNAAKGISECDRIKLFDRLASHAHCAIIANPIGPDTQKSWHKFSFAAGVPNLGGLARIDIRGLKWMYR